MQKSYVCNTDSYKAFTHCMDQRHAVYLPKASIMNKICCLGKEVQDASSGLMWFSSNFIFLIYFTKTIEIHA